MRRLSFVVKCTGRQNCLDNHWSEPSDLPYTLVRLHEMQNLDMKTMDDFLRVSPAMILGVWIQYPQIALNWYHKYANIGIAQPSDGV